MEKASLIVLVFANLFNFIGKILNLLGKSIT